MSSYLIGYTRLASMTQKGIQSGQPFPQQVATGDGPCHAYADGTEVTLCGSPVAFATRREWPNHHGDEGLCRKCQREAATDE